VARTGCATSAGDLSVTGGSQLLHSPPCASTASAKRSETADRFGVEVSEGESTRRRRLVPRSWLKWSVLVVAFAVALALDLVTKHLADQHLILGQTHRILPFFSLERTANNGVAFGLLGGSTALIVVANVVALLVVAGYVAFEKHALLAGIAGGAVMGGSVGNMIQRVSGDRLVTDFMKFPHWPNFNMADVFIDAGIAAIFLGVVVEVVLAWKRGRPRADAS
jgi:signal peptidase II